jgi:hypothetical protein
LAALHGKYITKKHQYKGVNEECYTFFQLWIKKDINDKSSIVIIATIIVWNKSFFLSHT